VLLAGLGDRNVRAIRTDLRQAVEHSTDEVKRRWLRRSSLGSRSAPTEPSNRPSACFHDTSRTRGRAGSTH
jgi:hypothetical protein